VDSSEPEAGPVVDDRRGLPADAELPLALKLPTEWDLPYHMYVMGKPPASPQALLRDLARPVKMFGVQAHMFDRIEVDYGATQALVETKAAMAERYIIDAPSLARGAATYRECVAAWRQPIRKALRTPYQRNK
jgi:hypothetical protein